MSGTKKTYKQVFLFVKNKVGEKELFKCDGKQIKKLSNAEK